LRERQIWATDAVKDNVYALARQAENFFHEVEMLVISRDSADSETAEGLRDEQVSSLKRRSDAKKRQEHTATELSRIFTY
jgi:hypothetical protein